MGRTGGLLKIRRVAGIAFRRHRGVVAQRTILMAGIAVQRRVRPHQGEAVVVILDCLYGDVPSVDAVALLAAGAHLTAVDIGVTLGALRTDIRKNRLDMALGTHHALVHAAQGKLGLIVIKLGNAANRLPPERGVAVGARQVQRSVWATGLRVHLCLPLDGCARRSEYEQQIDQDCRDQAVLTHP